ETSEPSPEPKEINLDDLGDLYNDYKDKQNSNYTDDSWKAFQQALTNAKELLAADIYEIEQIDVDTALEELQDAIGALLKDDESTDPEKEDPPIVTLDPDEENPKVDESDPSDPEKEDPEETDSREVEVMLGEEAEVN